MFSFMRSQYVHTACGPMIWCRATIVLNADEDSCGMLKMTWPLYTGLVRSDHVRGAGRRRVARRSLLYPITPSEKPHTYQRPSESNSGILDPPRKRWAGNTPAISRGRVGANRPFLVASMNSNTAPECMTSARGLAR